MCSHLEAPYAAGQQLRRSETAQARGIILPLTTTMTDDDLRRVASGLSAATEAVGAV
jgi:dTDP-4-amino-4,6-dideoxygalactose transaminase